MFQAQYQRQDDQNHWYVCLDKHLSTMVVETKPSKQVEHCGADRMALLTLVFLTGTLESSFFLAGKCFIAISSTDSVASLLSSQSCLFFQGSPWSAVSAARWALSLVLKSPLSLLLGWYRGVTMVVQWCYTLPLLANLCMLDACAATCGLHCAEYLGMRITMFGDGHTI